MYSSGVDARLKKEKTMKIKYNEKEILNFNETKKKVLMNDIPSEEFDSDIERRLQYIISHKHEQCMKRLREEWMPKLQAKGVAQVPLDDDQLAELIFSQPEYKNRSQRNIDPS